MRNNELIKQMISKNMDLMTYQEIANELNGGGVTTPFGKIWDGHKVANYARRYELVSTNNPKPTKHSAPIEIKVPDSRGYCILGTPEFIAETLKRIA